MKFKLMKVFFLVLLAVLAVSAVCAADNNATDEIVSMETNQSYDEISLENFDSEQINEIDLNRTEKSDEKSNEILGKINEEDKILSSTNVTPILTVSIIAPEKLTATKTPEAKLTAPKKVAAKIKVTKTKYKTFKGKSKYKWKIKLSTWNKMKKQAIKHYKFFRKHGSYYPGFSNGVKVTIKRGGHSYRGTAFAVRNYKGMRCEVRGLPYGERASTWGDY